MRRLQSFWALDLRALALFRMALGLIVFIDILIRCMDLVAHYTDWGIMPRAAVLNLGWQPEFWSLWMLNGTWPYGLLLFLLGGVASLSMAAGYRTRLATLASWLHLCSLHSRNPVVLDGGDTYLRCLMFWCIFLPWGARWSVDACRCRDEEGEVLSNQWLSVSTLAYMVQISLVYWMAAVLKSDAVWRLDFTAVYYALMVDQLATPRAAFLLARPELMKQLTIGCLIFEALGPCLLWLGAPLRWLGALGITCLHIGFGTFMHLGVFCMVGMAAPLGLWPGFFFDRVERAPWFGGVRKLAKSMAERWPLLGSQASRPKPLSGWVSVTLALLMVYVVYGNLTTIPGSRLPPAPMLGRLLRLDQEWNMFAPKPLEEDGWFVIDAEKVNGEHVDLYRDGTPLSWDKPEFVASTFPNARWRKFMMNLWSRDQSKWRLNYGQWLTRHWNENHRGGEQIRTFYLYYMLEKTLANGKTRPVEKVMLWHHLCFDSPSQETKNSR